MNHMKVNINPDFGSQFESLPIHSMYWRTVYMYKNRFLQLNRREQH